MLFVMLEQSLLLFINLHNKFHIGVEHSVVVHTQEQIVSVRRSQ